ncbi:hypothetical protein WR25_25584 [Diploscapter pachys]|uniref:Uncharacterized protein n=1 Tax=Diploscapter pachys TaxID=2018661 RepID=A0A2A2K2X2_9BILA|nr:hypothetical protein WR25_25584 [Diploscapter pachys]
MLLAIERIGTDLQSPFRISEHQIPMDTICETIERNLESMQREAHRAYSRQPSQPIPLWAVCCNNHSSAGWALGKPSRNWITPLRHKSISVSTRCAEASALSGPSSWASMSHSETRSCWLSRNASPSARRCP